MPTETSFALAADADCDDLAAIVNQSFRGEPSKEGWTTEAEFLDGQRTDGAALREFVAQPNHWIFKLHQESLILGLVQLSASPKHGQTMKLGMLTVVPNRQNSGVGKLILNHCETFARENGFTKMQMTVISLRQSLIDFYLRRGYHLLPGREPFPYGQPRFGLPKREDLDFVVLEKDL